MFDRVHPHAHVLAAALAAVEGSGSSGVGATRATTAPTPPARPTSSCATGRPGSSIDAGSPLGFTLTNGLEIDVD